MALDDIWKQKEVPYDLERNTFCGVSRVQSSVVANRLACLPISPTSIIILQMNLIRQRRSEAAAQSYRLHCSNLSRHGQGLQHAKRRLYIH